MTTTCASTTSEAPALPSNSPTSSACCGENAAISQPRRNPPQLYLPSRAAHPGNHGRRRRRRSPDLEADTVIGPNVAIVTLGSDEHARVVDDAHAERVWAVATTSSATRRRAASISASLNAPCSFSHSETARSPSRTRRDRRAAAVIQADTLTPSSAAAATTRAWTSESTVIASLGDGLPRGMAQHHYQSRRVMRTTAGGIQLWRPFRNERGARALQSLPGDRHSHPSHRRYAARTRSKSE